MTPTRKIGRVGSGGFDGLLREHFREVEDREEWWERTYPDPVDGEAADLLQFERAAWMVARRSGRSPMWRRAGFTYEDIFQVAWTGILIGLRSWHKRPPQCSSKLAWCMRNADWHCSRTRDIATINYRSSTRVPRLIHQAALDQDAADGRGEPFDNLVHDRRPDQHIQDMAMASLAVAILRERDQHRLADVLEARLFDGLTLQQIGDATGVGRERIRQLEAKAASKVVSDPRFRAAAQEHWPGWAPPDADGYHTNKPTIASKRQPKKPRLTATPEKKTTAALALALNAARRSGHLQAAP